jgi:hypothetical protein
MKSKFWQFAAAALFCAAAFPVHAASVSYFLDQSNENTFLPDGTNYLKVTISDSTTYAGDIEFLVETLSPLSSIAGSNYGIQSFGFNTSLTLTGSNIVGLPTGWTTNMNTNQDGFGNFDWVDKGTGSTRVDPLTFRITGIGGDIPSDYVLLSSGGGEAPSGVFFAAHVAGFNDVDPSPTGTVTSAYFGGSTPVPLPAALWLLGSGFAALGLFGRRAKRA